MSEYSYSLFRGFGNTKYSHRRFGKKSVAVKSREEDEFKQTKGELWLH